jgi:hypothetical protein
MLTPNSQSRNSYRSSKAYEDWPSDDEDDEGAGGEPEDPDTASYYSRNRANSNLSQPDWDLYDTEVGTGRTFLLAGGGGSVGGGGSREGSGEGRGSYQRSLHLPGPTRVPANGSSKLLIVKRPSEEEELQYVLELSLKDQ